MYFSSDHGTGISNIRWRESSSATSGSSISVSSLSSRKISFGGIQPTFFASYTQPTGIHEFTDRCSTAPLTNSMPFLVIRVADHISESGSALSTLTTMASSYWLTKVRRNITSPTDTRGIELRVGYNLILIKTSYLLVI